MSDLISWIAVKGKSEEEVFQELSLVKTDKKFDADYGDLTPKNGWFFVIINADGNKIVSKEMIKKLSLNCYIVSFEEDVTTMISEFEMYQGGKLLWFVVLDSNADLNDFEIIGGLPEHHKELLYNRMDVRYSEYGEAEIDFLAFLDY